MISGNIDNFMMSESKLDETFPAAQFLLQGFSMPYRLDRNRNGDMFYIREDIPLRLIKRKVRNNVEYFFVEINLRQKKRLLYFSYNPHKNSISNHVDLLRRELDIHSSNFENFLLPGDFNAEITGPSLIEFCKLYSPKNFKNKPTCFKNPDNPKVINLLLTNKPKGFYSSDTLETGLSDFHKLWLS